MCVFALQIFVCTENESITFESIKWQNETNGKKLFIGNWENLNSQSEKVFIFSFLVIWITLTQIIAAMLRNRAR